MDATPPDSPASKKWYSLRRRWAIPGAIVVAVSIVAAVVFAHPAANIPGSSPSANQGAAPNAVGSGYLAKEPGAVVFIQWTQTGNNLSGSAQVETLSGSPPSQSVSTNTISVSGQVDGSAITLSFNAGTKVFGTLSAGSFTVNFPQNDGSLAPVAFTEATATQFNQALADLQGNTGSANQSAAKSQAVTSEEQTIDKAAATVEADLSGLNSDSGTLSSDLGGFANDLAQAKADLTTTAQEEQTVIAESRNGTDPNQVCTDSDAVQTDADAVGTDGDAVSTTADSVATDISTLRSDISGIQQHSAYLWGAQSRQPSYRDGAPLQSTVNQAVTAAQAAIAIALNTANGDVAQVNRYETQAYNDAVAAARAGKCSPPATQYAQPTIS